MTEPGWCARLRRCHMTGALPGDTPSILTRIDLTLTGNGCDPTAPRIVLPAVLTYIAEDPYAVALSIHSPDGHDVAEWHLARDLLAEGLRRLAGIGDVRLRPVDQLVEISLSSPYGAATLATPRAGVTAFVHAIYQFLPRGCESNFQNIDLEETLFAMLLRPGWGDVR